MNSKPKPITFTIESDHDEGFLRQDVKFEIEGGGKAIQTSFVRKNEVEFFEFLNDFNNPKNPMERCNKGPRLHNSDQNVLKSVQRRQKTIKNHVINKREILSMRELEEVCEADEVNESIFGSDDSFDSRSSSKIGRLNSGIYSMVNIFIS